MTIQMKMKNLSQKCVIFVYKKFFYKPYIPTGPNIPRVKGPKNHVGLASRSAYRPWFFPPLLEKTCKGYTYPYFPPEVRNGDTRFAITRR